MRRFTRISLAVLIAGLAVHAGVSAAVSQAPQSVPGETTADAQEKRTAPLPTFEETPVWVQRFERPGREESQKPEEVVAALGVQPGQTVADVGAGSGYFTFHLARAVGAEGRVLAVDIEEGMLEYIRQRAATEEGGERVETVLAAADDPHLPDGEVDLILFVNTYHHLGERAAYLERLSGDLAAGGRIAIVDYLKQALPMGPPTAHKLSRDEVVAEFKRAGLQLLEEETFLPYQYFLIFSR